MLVKLTFDDEYRVIDDTQIRDIKILMLKGEKGDPGAGGVSDWGDIGGTLSNQTDLQNALDAKADAADVYTETEVDTLLAGKQNTLTFDTTPTASSTNPVTSGGVKTALDAKADAADVYTKTQTDNLLAGKQDTLTFDTTPTASSTNPVTSGGVKSALDNKADSSDVYTKTQTDNLLSGKQATLTFDTTPTASSTNPVTSGGVKSALDNKADSSDVYTKTQTDNLLAGKQDTLTFDTTPTASSTNPVTSGGVKSALDNKADSSDVYTKAQLDAVTDVTFSNISTYWTNGATGSSLKKCGHIVTGKITILNTDTALPGAAYTDLGKVSAKPVDDISVTLAPVGGSDKRVAIMLTSAGVVRAYNYNTTSSYTGTVLITYITND